MAIRNNLLGGTDYVKEHPSLQSLNDTNNAIINQEIGNAELGVRILQSNNVFTNGTNFVVDEMTDSGGTNNTVNTGSSTAFYDGVLDAYTIYQNNVENSNAGGSGGSGTSSTRTVTGSITSSKGYFSVCRIFRVDVGTSTVTAVVKKGAATIATGDVVVTSQGDAVITFDEVDYSELFESGDTYTVEFSNSGSGNLFNPTSTGSFTGTYFDFTNQDIATSGTPLLTFQESNNIGNGTVICDSNTATLDGNEGSFAVSVPDSDFPTDTSIKVKIGDGTNVTSDYTINPISKGVIVPATGLSSGTLEATFTLATTDTGVTPTIPSIGIKILR